MVNQPKYKNIYTNMTNLIKLNKLDESVITPNDYYKFNDYELLELNYNKEGFILTQDNLLKDIRNDSLMALNNDLEAFLPVGIVSKLISLYDMDKERGLSNFKVDDFVIDNNFYKNDNYLDTIHLYNAREISDVTFNDYIDQVSEYFDDKFNYADVKIGVDVGKKLIKTKK